MEPETGQMDVRTKTQALLEGALKCVQVAALAAALVPLGALVTTPKAAALGVCIPTSDEKHVTDGRFNLHNCGSPTSDDPEWGRLSTGSGGVNTTDVGVNNVSKTFFDVVGTAGGAWLYVEQGGGVAQRDNQLYLMYDWTNSPNVRPNGLDANSFFDVFFQVPRTGDDYVVRIGVNGIVKVVEKPTTGPASPVINGSFDLDDPIWEPLDQDELNLARFQGALGFGVSPNSTVPHLMAEFEVSFDDTSFPTGGPMDAAGHCLPGSHPSGFYDPCPAFWSASDDPISSALFTLDPNGGPPVVTMRLGANGAPVLQPQDAVPEPSTLLLMGTGLLGFLASVWRRTRRS